MKAPFNMSKNIQKRTISDENATEIAMEIYRDAVNYHLIATNAMQTLFPKAMAAITINAALACELFIKSILTLERRRFCKGHLLHQLFHDIQDDAIKARVIDSMSSYDFDGYLEEIDNVFPIARYLYEYQGRSCNLSFVLSLANALSSECQSLFDEERLSCLNKHQP